MTVDELEAAQSALAEDDLPLVDLTVEQFQALWASERWELQPENRNVDAAALKTLVTAGLADAGDMGIELVGPAAFIRSVCSSGSTVLWIESADGSPNRSEGWGWQVVSAGVLLETRPGPVGTLSFVLRDAARAIEDLARSSVGPGESSGTEDPALPSHTYDLSDLNDAKAFHELIQASGAATTIAYSCPDEGVLESGPLRTDFHRIDGALIVTRCSDRSTGLVARSEDDKTCEVVPATREFVEEALRLLLGVERRASRP